MFIIIIICFFVTYNVRFAKNTLNKRVVVVVLMFYVRDKNLRSCRDSQLT